MVSDESQGGRRMAGADRGGVLVYLEYRNRTEATQRPRARRSAERRTLCGCGRGDGQKKISADLKKGVDMWAHM